MNSKDFSIDSIFSIFHPPPMHGRALLAYYTAWVLIAWYLAVLVMLVFKKIKMTFWIPINAQVMEINERDKLSLTRPITNEIRVKYHYTYNGQHYKNTKVSVFAFTKNFSYDRALHDLLVAAKKNDATVQIWIDPKRPSASLITKRINWLDLAVVLLVCVAFYVMGILWVP